MIANLELWGWSLAEPFALWALLLAPLFLWLARRSDSWQSAWTSFLSLWSPQRLDGHDAPEPIRRRTPPWAQAGAAAIACAVLALAQPARVGAREPELWRVVVDRSPSMYLPWRSAGASERGATRLERALVLARPLLLELQQRGARILWSDASGAEVGSGAAPPEVLLARPELPLSELDPSRVDRERTLVLTDRQIELARAVVIASGGDAVLGAIAEADGALLVQVGAGLERRPLEPARWVELDPSWPAPLAQLARVWSESRGLSLIEGAPAERALELRSRSSGAPRSARIGRDGWTLEVVGEPFELSAGESEAWIRADAGRAWVAVGSGTVELGFTAVEVPAASGASFVVSWSELFDRSRRPHPEVVSELERADAGASFAAVLPLDSSEPGNAPPTPAASWFALGAAACALVALRLLYR